MIKKLIITITLLLSLLLFTNSGNAEIRTCGEIRTELSSISIMINQKNNEIKLRDGRNAGAAIGLLFSPAAAFMFEEKGQKERELNYLIRKNNELVEKAKNKGCELGEYKKLKEVNEKPRDWDKEDEDR